MFERPVFEQAIEELETEHNRKPSKQEIDERMADIEAKAIDEAYEENR